MEHPVLVLQRVGGFLVDILSFPVRNLAQIDVLPGDVDTLVWVTRGEVDNIHRVIGHGLRVKLCRTRSCQAWLIINLTGVTGVVVQAGSVGQVGLHHGQPSSVVK